MIQSSSASPSELTHKAVGWGSLNESSSASAHKAAGWGSFGHGQGKLPFETRAIIQSSSGSLSESAHKEASH